MAPPLSQRSSAAGSCTPRTARAWSLHAERIRVRVAHDRPDPLAGRSRFDYRGPRPSEAPDLGLAIVGEQVQMERERLGPGLLAALEQEAWARPVGILRRVVGVVFGAVEAGVPQHLQ